MKLGRSIGLLALLANAAWAAPQARVQEGALAGKLEEGVEEFFGIPYAAPPVGPLRWRAPQAPAPWNGTREATQFGHDCMQTPYPSDAAPLGVEPGEDCLYVNVWRPRGTRSGAHLPVLVWIYGGGFVNGGASPAVYSGADFARDGVMFVSFNYRVGRFGFFAFPELTREDPDHGLRANYGMLDAIASLKWLKKNIESLGGDPKRVTIYGQSAGAAQVYNLLTSPMATGLFTQAIIQSGGIIEKPPYEGDAANPIPIETAGVNFARRWHIEGTDAGALEQLRKLSPEQVTDGLHIGTMGAQATTFVGPVRDGRIASSKPLLENFASGNHAKVPLLLGNTAGDNYRMAATTLDEAYTTFGKASDKARTAYTANGPKDPAALIREMGRDRLYREPMRFIARKTQADGMPVYEYRYNYVVTPMKEEWKEGPLHATDIPFAMNTVRAKYGDKLTTTDLAVAKAMHGYWVNFVRSGNPNGPGLAPWPSYDASGDKLLEFSTDGRERAVVDPFQARLDAVAVAAGRQ